MNSNILKLVLFKKFEYLAKINQKIIRFFGLQKC